MASSGSLPPPPIFAGKNYDLWDAKMKTYLRAQSLWEIVKNGSSPTPLPENPTVAEMRAHADQVAKEARAKGRALAITRAALHDDVFIKILNLETGKEAWDKLKEEFQGTERTKRMNVLNLRREFEALNLENLTHLILSQCYLLDGMPKGIDKLTELQVLKGFLLGSSRNTPCKISDLANLKQLRRLSIHIRSEAVIKDGEFESLEELPKLQHLKISWGVFDKRYSEIQINLPPGLKKLHLEGFPGQKIPEWLKPSKLPRGLKELGLTGGKLESMNHEETNQWDMEIVRLKYIKHLEVDMTHLQMLFPSLRYALIKPIPNQSYTEWRID